MNGPKKDGTKNIDIPKKEENRCIPKEEGNKFSKMFMKEFYITMKMKSFCMINGSYWHHRCLPHFTM
jgi:deferrochelatase/peroxidase EfeB